jgi:HAD superfamily hydrolase (TIGR01459 family)
VLCDVWGVVHNGVAAHAGAVDALARYRAAGGRVLLVTNAPRPSAPIVDQLDSLGVPREAYDGIVSSGDVTRADLLARGVARAYMLGPDRDLSLFEDTPIALVEPDAAELVVCTGLVNDLVETPEDYRRHLAELAGRDLEFVCANPDIVVEKGERLLYCSGALAALYEEEGGRVTQYGKPHPPIYDAAMGRLGEIAGAPLARSQVLVIGDGLFTDIRGAVDNGFDALFVTAGVHAAELGGSEPAADQVAARLSRERLGAIGFQPRLSW